MPARDLVTMGCVETEVNSGVVGGDGAEVSGNVETAGEEGPAGTEGAIGAAGEAAAGTEGDACC